MRGDSTMIRKTTIAVLVIIAALCFAVPAAAETFTSSDGVLSIELPDESWEEIEDPTKWIVLSDGGNVITIEHYSNGEKLPDIAVADDHYVDVYQAIFSTQNEVFIITGLVVNAEDIPEVAQAIMSAKVLKYDTKVAVKKENETHVSEYSVVSMDKTMYVTANELNVRAGCSTDDQILGTLKNGSAVRMLGSVQRNGEDTGWYQIEYGSGTGYVAGNFLSDTAPAQKTDSGTSSDTAYSGAVKTVYDEMGEAYTLYEGMDGYWRDRSGTAYVRLSDTDFQVYEGTKRLTTYYPLEVYEEDFYSHPSVTVYDEYGQAYKIYQGSDGYWREEDGTTYVQLSDSEFQVKDGNKHVFTS